MSIKEKFVAFLLVALLVIAGVATGYHNYFVVTNDLVCTKEERRNVGKTRSSTCVEWKPKAAFIKGVSDIYPKWIAEEWYQDAVGTVEAQP